MGNTALILEGGAMRATYTVGVLDAMLKEKFFPSRLYAVSAGACNACSYLSRQYGRNIEIVRRYLRDSRYISFRNLLFHGEVFGFNFIFNDLANSLLPFDYESFQNSQQQMIVVATNCETGKAEYLTSPDVQQMFLYCQASSSMPLLSRIKKIDGLPYLDGGIADSVPVQKSLDDGNEKHVVVLTRNKGYRKKMSNHSVRLMRLMYSEYPEIAAAYQTRWKRYNQTMDLIDKLEVEGKIVVIRPSQPVNIGHIERDISRLSALYQMGLEDTKRIFDSSCLHDWN